MTQKSAAKITVASSTNKNKPTMSGARNTSFEESKIFQQAASQFMERLFCCTSSGTHHSQVYEVSTEYRTSSKQQQQQQDLNESFLSENTLLASPTSTSDGNNNFNTSSIISSGLDLLSRSTGDKTLLSPAVQESPSPRPHRNNNNTPHPGSPGFIFLDGSASPPSRHHHRRNHSQNSVSSASISIGTPTSSPSSLSHRETQQYASPFAVIRRNETATTASVSSDDDMTQPSQIPAIQSSQTFDEDDGGEHDMVYEEEGDSSEGLWTNNSFQHATVWSRGSDETTEPTHHLSHNNNKVPQPKKQQSRHATFKEEPPDSCTSPIPSLSTLRAAKQKSKQAASSRAASMDVRRLQAEFNQQRPTSRREQQQFIC